MTNALFTAFALIAAGQANVPPAPPESAPPPGIVRNGAELIRRLDRFARDDD
jgi:hypothetical protein